MNKKILSIMFTICFAGAPFFAMAEQCAMGPGYDACVAAGGTPISNAIPTGNSPVSNVTPTGAGTQGNPLAVSAQLKNPIKFNTFSDFVAQVTKSAVEILLPFVVLAFIYSGFLFVRAQGNTEDLKKAKSAIGWSVVGAFILMGAWGFAQIISTTVARIAG